MWNASPEILVNQFSSTQAIYDYTKRQTVFPTSELRSRCCIVYSKLSFFLFFTTATTQGRAITRSHLNCRPW